MWLGIQYWAKTSLKSWSFKFSDSYIVWLFTESGINQPQSLSSIWAKKAQLVKSSSLWETLKATISNGWFLTSRGRMVNVLCLTKQNWGSKTNSFFENLIESELDFHQRVIIFITKFHQIINFQQMMNFHHNEKSITNF